MSYQSHSRKGHSLRREKSVNRDQLSGTIPRGHRKHGNTESLGKPEGYNFKTTTLDSVSEEEDQIRSRKFLEIFGETDLEVFGETDAYPPSVIDQVERARSQNFIQLHRNTDSYRQDINHDVEPPLSNRSFSAGTRGSRTNTLYSDGGPPRQGRIDKQATNARANSLMKARMIKLFTLELNKLTGQPRDDSGLEDEGESSTSSRKSAIPEYFALAGMPGAASLTHSWQAAPPAEPSKHVDWDPFDIMWVPTSSKDFPKMASMAEGLLLRRFPHLGQSALEQRRNLTLKANASVGIAAFAHATSYYEKRDVGSSDTPLDSVIDRVGEHLGVIKQRRNVESVTPHGWAVGKTHDSEKQSVLSPSRLGPPKRIDFQEAKRLIIEKKRFLEYIFAI